jgi:hypothetical protein
MYKILNKITKQKKKHKGTRKKKDDMFYCIYNLNKKSTEKKFNKLNY